jgi:hypothetical protein
MNNPAENLFQFHERIRRIGGNRSNSVTISRISQSRVATPAAMRPAREVRRDCEIYFPFGFYARDPVVPGEQREEWIAFRDELVASYDPANPTERVLATRIAEAAWRLHLTEGFKPSGDSSLEVRI